MRDLIIIPPDGKNSKNYLRTRVEIPKKHVEVLNEYIINNKINLDPETSMYIQSILMAVAGYCVVEISDIDFNAYIPNVITREQYSWFNENLEEISKYSISADLLDSEEGIVQIKRQVKNGPSPLVKLYTLLERRLEGVVKENDVPRSK